MPKSRLIYLILIITTVAIGLLSRHFKAVPLFVGDILWALMVYFIIRLLFINRSLQFITVVSLLLCYAVEFSQLYKAPWLNNIRHTTLGHLVLGEGFLWSDLLCYTIGVGIGWLMDKRTTPNY